MLNDRKIGEIQALYHLKKNVSATAKAASVSRASVEKFVQLGTNTSKYKPRATVKRVADRLKIVKRLARQVSQKDGRKWPTHGSAMQIRRALAIYHGINMSRRQVQRDLLRCGLHSYVRPPTPTRRTQDKDRRRAFARRELRLDHRRLVFSDESWLTCNEKTGRNQWAKSKADVFPRERRARWNIASVMVWAAFGHNYRSKLVVFPAKRDENGEKKPFRLNAAMYVRRCLQPIVPDLLIHGKTFLHDGARSHASKVTGAYLTRKGVSFVKDFPPYSPHFNMIEPLWKTLAERVGDCCPMNVEELTAAAKRVWDELPVELLNAHAAHFPNSLKRALFSM